MTARAEQKRTGFRALLGAMDKRTRLPVGPLANRTKGGGNTEHNLRPRLGFTLLELLVALLMTSILAASLVATIRIVFKAHSSSEAAVEPSRTAELAMDLIRADLESALPPSGTFKGNFTGSNNVLDFYSTGDSPEHVDANGEIKLVELVVEVPSGGSDRGLARRVRRNLTAQNPPDPDEEIVCRGVSAFTLEYFDGSAWQPSWDSTENLDTSGNPTLPAAVRVTLTLERPQQEGQARMIRFVRVFALSCSTTLPGSNGGVNNGN